MSDLGQITDGTDATDGTDEERPTWSCSWCGEAVDDRLEQCPECKTSRFSRIKPTTLESQLRSTLRWLTVAACVAIAASALGSAWQLASVFDAREGFGSPFGASFLAAGFGSIASEAAFRLALLLGLRLLFEIWVRLAPRGDADPLSGR